MRMCCKEKVIGGIKMNLCSNFDVKNHECLIKDIQFEQYVYECPHQKTCKLFNIASLPGLAIIYDDKFKKLDIDISMLNRRCGELDHELVRDACDTGDNNDVVLFFWLLGLTFVCTLLVGHALIG